MNEIPKIAAATSVLSEADLEKFVIGRYKLHNGFVCKLFRTGINHTYIISDGTTKFILRVYCRNWKTGVEISEEVRLLDLLHDNQVEVSYALPDPDGKYIQTLSAPEGLRYAVLFTFGSGGKIRFLNPDTCFTIGSAMAKMHDVTSGKSLRRVTFDEHTLLHDAYKNITTIFSEDLSEIMYLKHTIATIAEVLTDTKSDACASGIVHLDIWYDNMSVRSDTEITLFDFDNCGNGKLIFDLAYFCKQLFHIETDKQQYEQKVTAFLAGYRSKRDISNVELELIPHCATAIFVYYLGMQASRFDWSNIFLSENYLKMYVGRIQAWTDYNAK